MPEPQDDCHQGKHPPAKTNTHFYLNYEKNFARVKYLYLREISTHIYGGSFPRQQSQPAESFPNEAAPFHGYVISSLFTVPWSQLNGIYCICQKIIKTLITFSNSFTQIFFRININCCIKNK